MPFVANSRQASTDPVSELLAKFARPLPHRFVADDDAAGRQQLLNHAQPEREAEIQPDGVADDLGGEPITSIAGASRCHHPTRLPTSVRFRKRGAAKLTVPSRDAWPRPLFIWEEQPVKAPQLADGEGRHYVGGKQVQRAHALLARQSPPGETTNHVVAATLSCARCISPR